MGTSSKNESGAAGDHEKKSSNGKPDDALSDDTETGVVFNLIKYW